MWYRTERAGQGVKEAPSRAVLSVNRPRRLWIRMPVFAMSPEPRIPIRKGASLPRAPANGFRRGIVVGEGGRQLAEGPGLGQKVLRFLLGRFHGVGAGDPSPRRGGLAGDLHKALGGLGGGARPPGALGPSPGFAPPSPPFLGPGGGGARKPPPCLGWV